MITTYIIAAIFVIGVLWTFKDKLRWPTKPIYETPTENECFLDRMEMFKELYDWLKENRGGIDVIAFKDHMDCLLEECEDAIEVTDEN